MVLLQSTSWCKSYECQISGGIGGAGLQLFDCVLRGSESRSAGGVECNKVFRTNVDLCLVHWE